MRRHDRARGRADERLALTQIQARSVLDSGQHAHHPCLTEHAAASEHEDVGAGAHATQAIDAGRNGGRGSVRSGCWRATPDELHTDVRDNVRDWMAVTEQQLTAPGVLGARVRSLREAMDLSLRDLAERSGVSAP